MTRLKDHLLGGVNAAFNAEKTLGANIFNFKLVFKSCFCKVKVNMSADLLLAEN